MGIVKVRDINKSFGPVHVIKGVDFEIFEGEFVVFVGPSGCGKSTMLRLISGLEDVSSGSIEIDGNDVTSVPTAERGLAMVFQSYALYPQMNVRQNMSFGLKLMGTSKARITETVEKAAKTLRLDALLDRKPAELSGGQRQRVAIGRAIVRDPSVFLFDEPLSNLDAALRVQTRKEIARLQKHLAKTMIYVTHDQVEAMTLADRIFVFNDGIIQQEGAPLELYDKPANLFVATFIGSPTMNILDCQRAKGGIRFGNGKILALKNIDASPVNFGVRPEHIALTGRDDALFSGRVESAEHLGSDSFLNVEIPDVGMLNVRVAGGAPVKASEIIHLKPDLGKIHLFDDEAQRIQQD